MSTALSQDRTSGLSSAVAIKAPVRVATTANITLSGLQSIDGVTVVANDRVLVKNQTTASQNGVYLAKSTAWERAKDFDGNRDIVQGTIISVVSGSANSLSYWRVTTANPITVGTSSLAFGAALVDDAAAVIYQDPDPAAIPVSVASIHRSRVRPQFWGAQGDGVTNDTAAILKAMQVAANRNCLCEIPGTDLGYRLNTAVVATDLDYLQVEGEGILIPVGGNALTIDSSIHVSISGIGIYGTSASGHGIELINGAHYGKFFDMWLGWVNGDGIKVTSGQSNLFTNMDIDQNIAFRPVALQGGLTDGNIKHGVHIPYNASGNGNNQSFVNCRVNAAGATYSLKVGDTGGAVDSFLWLGGLLQGSAAYQEFYLRTRDGAIKDCHIEPPVGATANYVGTLDRCSNTRIEGGVLAGDVNLTGANSNTGAQSVRGAGVNASNAAGSVGCYWRDCQYKNITTGPTGGSVIDPYGVLDSRGLKNASNDYVHTGWGLSDRAVPYLHTNFEDWLGGVAPTLPAGWFQVGGTLSRSATAYAGTYSAEMLMSADNTQYIGVSLQPIEQIRGKRVAVVARVRNAVTASLANIYAVTAGGANAGTRLEGSWLSNAFERMIVTFDVPSDATNFQIRLTGAIGTVNWDEASLWIEGFDPSKAATLANSATPDVSVGGRMVPDLLTGGTTNITNFPDAHPGVPFTVYGDHVVSVVHDSAGAGLGPIRTRSGANIAMSGIAVTFKRKLSNGLVYEVG